MQTIYNLLNKFKITPKNLAIYEQAFTHSSYAHDTHTGLDYEKLEFLGDAVIELIVTEHLYNKYKDMDEGTLTKSRIIIVQSKTLVKAAKILMLQDLVKLGGSLRGQSEMPLNILEDVFEAFIGAIFLDQGIEKCKKVLKQTIIHLYEIKSLNDNIDWKSKLQEFLQKNNKDIVYKIINNKEDMHTAEVYICHKKTGIGYGAKIKDAQMAAAKNAYHNLQQRKK